MTTAVYNRKTREVGADTQNTAGGANVSRVKTKIEVLANGLVFLGSGHSLTIGQCRQWAAKGLATKDTPDWETYLSDPTEYGFECLVIDPKTWKVWLIDAEMVPIEIEDDFYGVGSGAAYAIGALMAGASMRKALKIAGERDAFTSGPYEVKQIG